MRKFTPTFGELYHIFNRGTEKRPIFLSQKDYSRFIVNLVLFNTDQKPVDNIRRYNPELAYQKIPKDPLVKIHAFSLMPNHFHLVLEQLIDDGISRFMHKNEMGYSHYFNKLHSRNGNLFQGAYKIKHVDNDAYRLYLPLYVHLNALDLYHSEKNWREKGIQNKTKAVNFLKDYPWSSLGEYLNINPMPFIARDILDELYKNSHEWKTAFYDWLPEYQTLFSF